MKEVDLNEVCCSSVSKPLPAVKAAVHEISLGLTLSVFSGRAIVLGVRVVQEWTTVAFVKRLPLSLVLISSDALMGCVFEKEKDFFQAVGGSRRGRPVRK